MARDHARVKLSIWEDDDFRALSPAAQHLYFVLLTSPEMNYAGVTDWRPNRIAKRAGAWTPGAVEVAAAELAERLYVVVDTDTEEAALRSFVRHDELLEQPNLAVAVRKAWSAVASPRLRGVIVHELIRLRKDKPELKGWPKIIELLDKPSIDPSVDPSFHPSIDPSVDPSGWGSFGGTPNPSIDPSDDPSPITDPYSSSPLPAPRSTKTVGGSVRGERQETLQAANATEPPKLTHPGDARCPDHVGVLNPPSCSRCKAARLTAERVMKKALREAEQERLDCGDCGGTNWIEDPKTGLPAGRCEKHRRSA